MNPAPDPREEPAGSSSSANQDRPQPQATVYLAFVLPPGTMPGGLAGIQLALASAARRITATGHPVRYLNGMYMPAKNRLLCVFTAEDEIDVYDTADLVNLPFTQIHAITDRCTRDWP